MTNLTEKGRPEPRDQRLVARVTPTDKALIERAALLSGTTVSGFVVSTLRRRAQEAIQQHSEMELSDRDREALVSALLEQEPEPSEAMKRAARAHDSIRVGRPPGASE